MPTDEEMEEQQLLLALAASTREEALANGASVNPFGIVEEDEYFPTKKERKRTREVVAPLKESPAKVRRVSPSPRVARKGRPSFRTVAFDVLKEAGCPLSPKEIVTIAIRDRKFLQDRSNPLHSTHSF